MGILVYLGLSHPISVYFRLSRLSQAFLAVSGYISLTWPILAILYYLGLPWPIRGYIRLSQPSQASFGYLGISWAISVYHCLYLWLSLAVLACIGLSQSILRYPWAISG